MEEIEGGEYTPVTNTEKIEQFVLVIGALGFMFFLSFLIFYKLLEISIFKTISMIGLIPLSFSFIVNCIALTAGYNIFGITYRDKKKIGKILTNYLIFYPLSTLILVLVTKNIIDNHYILTNNYIELLKSSLMLYLAWIYIGIALRIRKHYGYNKKDQ